MQIEVIFSRALSNPSVPVAKFEIQNQTNKNLKGSKKLPLKVVGTGLENDFCDLQLFNYKKVWQKRPKPHVLSF